MRWVACAWCWNKRINTDTDTLGYSATLQMVLINWTGNNQNIFPSIAYSVISNNPFSGLNLPSQLFVDEDVGISIRKTYQPKFISDTTYSSDSNCKHYFKILCPL